MAKQKTKRGWVKRVKRRKSGLIARRKAGKRHLMSSKSKQRKRRLSKTVVLSKADRRRVKGLI